MERKILDNVGHDGITIAVTKREQYINTISMRYCLCIITQLVYNIVKCISYSWYSEYSLRCLITQCVILIVVGLKPSVGQGATICETQIPFAYIGESATYSYVRNNNNIICINYTSVHERFVDI